MAFQVNRAPLGDEELVAQADGDDEGDEDDGFDQSDETDSMSRVSSASNPFQVCVTWSKMTGPQLLTWVVDNFRC